MNKEIAQRSAAMLERIPRLTAAAIMVSLVVACAHKNPNERVTGNGGSRLFRVSSHQITVDLTETERLSLAKVQDRHIKIVSEFDAVNASAVALNNMGFAPVKTDTELQQVEGEKNKVVSIRWRAAIRAILKAKGIPLSGKPDHESVRALISVRPQSAADAMLVRARFDVTVWDTNGDARTTTVHDGAIYACFFSQLNYALFGERPRDTAKPICNTPTPTTVS